MSSISAFELIELPPAGLTRPVDVPAHRDPADRESALVSLAEFGAPRSYAVVFMKVVSILGLAAILCAAWRLALDQLDPIFWIIALSTLVLGSRTNVKVPGFKTNVSISDVFIFLVMLVFGGAAAVLLAAGESLYSSYRITKGPLTRFFNSAVMAISTLLTVAVMTALFGPVQGLARSGGFSRLIVAACMMALVQYAGNSGLVASAGALRAGQPVASTWRKHYVWISGSYFAAALAAALIAKVYVWTNLYALFATIPIVGLVYFTYKTYLRNAESSVARAELAEVHLRELSESEQRFRSAFDFAPIGMALVAPDGRWLQVNRSLCDILGYSEDELLAMKFQQITFAEDLPSFVEHMDGVLAGREPSYQLETRYIHSAGHLVWALVSASLIRQAGGQQQRLIFQIEHITDRKQAEEQLLHDASHDALTGLPNRARFMDQLQMTMNRVKTDPQLLVAVLFLDLDRFKVINDSIGHIFGDRWLNEVASRLNNCVRGSDMVARQGGDEFTILLSGLQSEFVATKIAERIQREVAMPFKLGAYEICSTVSIGIAFCGPDYEQAEDVLRDADTAMYHAKSLGKAQYAVFDRCMGARAMSLMQVETDLRRAVERREFFLLYQPIFCIQTGTLIGFEALIRWRHPERGIVSPIEFIPVAEETGWMVPMGRWVIQEACSQMREWQEQFSKDLPLFVSVNLSSKQFAHSGLFDEVIEALNATGLDPSRLKLEITESVVMDNMDIAVRILDKLRAFGVESALDDFGTGYSSLSYLHKLPISTIKIDRSFVSRICKDTENREIIRTIILLARNLQMSVVAEGIETSEEFEVLKEMNCENAQGFYFSRPVDPAAIGQMIWDSLHLKPGTGASITSSSQSFEPLMSAYSM